MHLDLQGEDLAWLEGLRLAGRFTVGAVEPGAGDLGHRAVRSHVGEAHEPVRPDASADTVSSAFGSPRISTSLSSGSLS